MCNLKADTVISVERPDMETFAEQLGGGQRRLLSPPSKMEASAHILSSRSTLHSPSGAQHTTNREDTALKPRMVSTYIRTPFFDTSKGSSNAGFEIIRRSWTCRISGSTLRLLVK
jgi:hypothetical protein